MSKNESITIEKLKWFIKEDNRYGWVSHLWFRLLRNKYPFEYLHFTLNDEKSKCFREETIKSVCFNFNFKLESILKSELNETEVETLNEIRSVLFDLYDIKRKIK